jgi:hypothetical protein
MWKPLTAYKVEYEEEKYYEYTFVNGSSMRNYIYVYYIKLLCIIIILLFYS